MGTCQRNDNARFIFPIYYVYLNLVTEMRFCRSFMKAYFQFHDKMKSIIYSMIVFHHKIYENIFFFTIYILYPKFTLFLIINYVKSENLFIRIKCDFVFIKIYTYIFFKYLPTYFFLLRRLLWCTFRAATWNRIWNIYK